MSRGYLCRECGEGAAVLKISSEAVAKFPDSWHLCVNHLRISMGLPPLPPKKAKPPHPAYEMFKHEPPTCYGDAGKCPNKGTLYASGPWCDDHSPRKKNQ